MKTIKIALPFHFASYLVNGEPSRDVSDAECDQLAAHLQLEGVEAGACLGVLDGWWFGDFEGVFTAMATYVFATR